MIDLGATDFYINVPSLPRHEFEIYSTRLFDEWEAYVEQVLKIPDYALALEVEEGSIKGGAKIAAALYALYIGIGQYGSFVSGLQTIQGQISSASDFLTTHATNPFSSSNIKPKVRKHTGSLGELQRLFYKVQQGKITPEQAMVEAEIMFGDEADSAPDFMSEMKTSLENTPLLATQLKLPLNTVEHEALLQTISKRRQPSTPRPKPEPPIGQQIRVEIWRDSKKDKRNVRVIKL